MERFVALRDRRLAGTVPVTEQLGTIHVDGSTPLTVAFRAIAASAGTGRVKALFILCHGFAGINNSKLVSMDAGGMGLLLGRETLVHSNVGLWRAIRNKVENIVIYACGAADTQPGNEGSVADGRYLMGALAVHTNADVYAADRIQWYSNAVGGVYDFGLWEGLLTRFSPNGRSAPAGRRAPFELADVLTGSL